MATVSGFTFIKNGITLGYPILESVLSIAPLCDEVIINVGFDDPSLTGDDGTYDYLKSHLSDSKFKILKSWWDPAIKESGNILSVQTNIALDACTGDYCQYIQGDECIHEDDLTFIKDGILAMENNKNIDGLIFNYLHFYGNVDTYKYIRSMYRREVRLIRNHLGIKSWKDAQGFRTKNNKKITARLIKARVFHYGWARAEKVMAKKVVAFDRFYHGDKRDSQDEFKYARDFGLRKFMQTHPKVMGEWILKNKNPIDLMNLPLNWNKNIIGLWIAEKIEMATGVRIGEYKNYKKV